MRCRLLSSRYFGLFAVLASLAMVFTDLRRPALALAAVIVIGIADELAQTQLPGRSADIPDLATDVAGAVVAVMVLVAARRYFTNRFAPYRPPS